MNHKDKRFNFRPTAVRYYDNGKGFCRLCGEPAGKGRTRSCSEECYSGLYIRINANYARYKVYERDKGICAICKTNADDHKRESSYSWQAKHTWEADHIIPVKEGGGGCGLEGLRTLCIKCHGKESGLLRKRLNQKRSPQRMLF